MQVRFGVRGRLLLAFFGISGFALLGAVTAIYSLGRIGEAVDRITQERVPTALASQELSRQAERIVAAAPALLTVTTEAGHKERSQRIMAEVGSLNTALADLAGDRTEGAAFAAMDPLVEHMRVNLQALDRLVEGRLEATSRKVQALRRLLQTYSETERLLAPWALVMEGAVDQWRTTIANPGLGADDRIAADGELDRSLPKLRALRKAQLLISSFTETLQRAALTDEPGSLKIMVFRLKQSLGQLEQLTAGLDPKLQPLLGARLDEFGGYLLGLDSIPEIRMRELELVAQARGLLQKNTELSQQLTEAVDRLVAGANQDIAAANRDALSVQHFSAGALGLVVALSLVCSFLIVWRYVGRNLIARVSALSASMLAIADGNLRVPLPAATGDDEIADMTRALTVFRDTAIEIEDNNLREIGRARQRLVDAIESISEGFALYDADDRLVLCNSRYRELLYPGIGDVMEPGTPFETIIRRAAERGLVESAKGQIEPWVAERLASHRNPSGVQVQHRSGDRWIQIGERKTADGSTVAVYSDITELSAAREEAERASEAKSAFLANVSHELRTPLTSILGFARIIQGRLAERILPLIETDDGRTQRAVRQVQDNLEIILTEGRRLTLLVNNVLDLEKIEAGKMDWQMAPLAIGEVIEQAHAAAAALFTEKRLAFHREVAEGLPEIAGDRDKLVQTVINLTSNALKFTDQGSVTCRAELADGEIRVSVIDTGLGIAADDQPKVFEKFKQVGNTLTDKPKGTGLGLPICKEIVEHHGGRIWVESAPGEGSTFRFTLPVPKVDPATGADARIEVLTEDRDALLADLTGPAVATAGGGRKRDRRRVLVADDDASIRRLLRDDLEAAGYRVIEAENGREALELARDQRPDLLILDVLMPEGSGFEVVAILRSEPRTMGIPILMLTVVEEQERAFRMGVDRYLMKPIDEALLLRDVQALLKMGVSGRRVLVVEEEAGGRSLVAALSAHGHVVSTAAAVNECLEQARATRPDLIIANAALAERAGMVSLFSADTKLKGLALVLVR